MAPLRWNSPQLLAMFMFIAIVPLSACHETATPKPTRFELTSVMIPMRDGIKLQTAILRPRSMAKPLPILFSRTPYGIIGDTFPHIEPPNPGPLEKDGYIFVFQNIRGRFKSEGTFAMNRPPREDRNDPRATDESTDAYDTIEWLVHQVPGNNGRVGMTGTSYDAWTATMALLEPHPALKAISERASPADDFIGDDFLHNGALRLNYTFEYSALVEATKDQNTQFQFDTHDTYDWYLALGPIANVNARYFKGRVPFWNDIIAHPNRDDFWQKRDITSHLKGPPVPAIHVAGWWDQEDFRGPIAIYQRLEQADPHNRNFLVVGPWNHGGWGGPGRKLGPIDFASDTGSYFQEQIDARWFAHWLHDKPMAPLPEAEIFVTGRNQWQRFPHWPPTEGVTPTRLYLHPKRHLAFTPPVASGADAADEYVSDPASPVPFMRRPIRPVYQNSEWSIWQVLDQRFVDRRPDVLSWETDDLQEDVVIAGDVIAELFASTSGTDSDWIVKLIDVYPEEKRTPPKLGDPAVKETTLDLRGYQLMIANEVFRARFHKSFSHPEPIPAGQIVPYRIDLHSHAHAFLKGHRIMVQVQSTLFPLIERNPQQYFADPSAVQEKDYTKATQRIFRTPTAASALLLPVLKG